jgi:hypothetical protein
MKGLGTHTAIELAGNLSCNCKWPGHPSQSQLTSKFSIANQRRLYKLWNKALTGHWAKEMKAYFCY